MAAPSSELYAGRVFKNYDEFRKLLDEHCSTHSQIFILKNAQTVEWKNRRAISTKGHYPLDWKYVNCELRCKHFGTYTSVSTGKRKQQETFKTGCTSVIKLAANKKQNGLVITEANLDHTGHNSIETVNDAMVYPEMRRLNSTQLDDVKKMLSMKVATAKIIQHIKETSGIILSTQDLVNVRRQLKKDGKTEEMLTKDLFQELTTKDPGAAVDIVVDNNSKETSLLFFQTSEMKKYFKKYPSVIFLDATYKVNNRHMPLFTFMCVDGDHRGQVVAYGLVVNEIMNVISDLINCFISHNSHIKEQTSTFVVDKDFSEIQSIKLALPCVNIVLCKWHVENAVRRSLKGYCQSDKKQILELVVKMLKCHLESEYDQLVSQLVSGFPSYEAYFINNWHCCKESWAGCFVRKHCTYGNLTNNFVESHNHKIKFLVSHYSSVPMLVKELLAFHEAKSCSSEVKKSKLSLKKKNIHSSVPLLSDVVASIYQCCAPYGAKIITQQLETSFEKIHIVNDFEVVGPNGHTYHIENGKCNCFVSQSQQLVCSHLFSFRRENGYPLFQQSDIPYQHKLATFLSKFEEPDQPNSGLNIQVSQQLPTPRILNQNEKYRKADKLLSEISSVMSGLAQREFDAHFDMFKGIVDAIKQGKHVIYFVDDAVTTIQSTVLDNTVQSPVLDPAVSDAIVSDVATVQSPVLDSAVSDAIVSDVATVQSPVLDSAVSDAIVSDVATVQSPVLDSAVSDAIVSDVATVQSPVLDSAVSDAIVSDVATVQSPVLDSAVSDAIVSDVATVQSPVLDSAVSDAIVSDVATVQSPVLDSAVSDAIVSDVATVQSPVLDSPSDVFGFPPCPPSPVVMSVPSSTLSDTLPSNEALINQTQASSSTHYMVSTSSSLSATDDNEFKFPTKIKKRGRPKENKKLKSFKRKKIETYTSDKQFLEAITAVGLVPFVLKGDILIDHTMLKKTDEIPQTITSISESNYRQYFTTCGWKQFLQILIDLRSKAV